MDSVTGAPLGICWIKYEGDDKEGGHGQLAALEAIKKVNGQRVGVGQEGRNVKVEMDGQGKKCKAVVQAECERRRAERHKLKAKDKESTAVPNHTSRSHVAVVTPSSLAKVKLAGSDLSTPIHTPLHPSLPPRPVQTFTFQAQPSSSGSRVDPDHSHSSWRDRSPDHQQQHHHHSPPSHHSRSHQHSYPSDSTPTRDRSPSPIHRQRRPLAGHDRRALPNSGANTWTAQEEDERHQDILRELAKNGNDHILIARTSLPRSARVSSNDLRDFFTDNNFTPEQARFSIFHIEHRQSY